MSKIKALITTLILGSSSLAMAAPGATFSAQASWNTGVQKVITAPNVRDHRTVDTMARHDDRPNRRPRAAWIALGEPKQLARGRDLIRVAAKTPFSQLRIQSTAGATRISQLTVVYTDGTRQVMQLDRRINPRNPMIEVDLAGTRQVASLLISGSSSRRASYQVFGHTTRAGQWRGR